MKRKSTGTFARPAKQQKHEVFVENDPTKAGGGHCTDDPGGPFAQGQFRYVYSATYDKGPRTGQKCVCKEFKTGCVWEASYFDDDIKAVKKAGEIIQSFNELGIVSKPIHLNKPQVWTGASGTIKGQKSLVEPMIQGEYFKFNSNTGYESPDSATMQALSHFSYHVSDGKYLLCDLQGGRYANRYVLTDPVILSAKKEFGGTDLGQQGIDNFMAHHTCGRFCKPEWKKPPVTKLIPTFKAVSGTTFGTGISLFSSKEVQDLQNKVKKLWKNEDFQKKVKKLWKNK